MQLLMETLRKLNKQRIIKFIPIWMLIIISNTNNYERVIVRYWMKQNHFKLPSSRLVSIKVWKRMKAWLWIWYNQIFWLSAVLLMHLFECNISIENWQTTLQIFMEKKLMRRFGLNTGHLLLLRTFENIIS